MSSQVEGLLDEGTPEEIFRTTHVITDVLNERRRQINREGYTRGHDDEHDEGELAAAAACLAYSAHQQVTGTAPQDVVDDWIVVLWPWSEPFKAKNPRNDLLRAAALIVAEVERLDRLAPPPVGTPSHGGRK
jgi:hypothetical protein